MFKGVCMSERHPENWLSEADEPWFSLKEYELRTPWWKQLWHSYIGEWPLDYLRAMSCKESRLARKELRELEKNLLHK